MNCVMYADEDYMKHAGGEVVAKDFSEGRRTWASGPFDSTCTAWGGTQVGGWVDYMALEMPKAFARIVRTPGRVPEHGHDAVSQPRQQIGREGLHHGHLAKKCFKKTGGYQL